jgi:hypothetical protein
MENHHVQLVSPLNAVERDSKSSMNMDDDGLQKPMPIVFCVLLINGMHIFWSINPS